MEGSGPPFFLPEIQEGVGFLCQDGDGFDLGKNGFTGVQCQFCSRLAGNAGDKVAVSQFQPDHDLGAVFILHFNDGDREDILNRSAVLVRQGQTDILGSNTQTHMLADAQISA